MARTYTIGQLAKAGGVPVSTLRFYERAGLLRPESRSGSNYRTYDSGSLIRLQFIKVAQAAGLSLSDISGLIDLTDLHAQPCAKVQSILRHRLSEIEQRLTELVAVRDAVQSALQTCYRGSGAGLCSDLRKLKRERKNSA